MARREIVVNLKQYKLPERISTPAYLDYCDTQDKLDGAKNYRRAQFECMADAIVEVYGNQFTRADIFDAEHGLTPAQIVVEFSALEVYTMEATDKELEKIQQNFISLA